MQESQYVSNYSGKTQPFESTSKCYPSQNGQFRGNRNQQNRIAELPEQSDQCGVTLHRPDIEPNSPIEQHEILQKLEMMTLNPNQFAECGN
jgi:hypothetical protein